MILFIQIHVCYTDNSIIFLSVTVLRIEGGSFVFVFHVNIVFSEHLYALYYLLFLEVKLKVLTISGDGKQFSFWVTN